MKIKLTFAYNGSVFMGSATQPHKQSVQDVLQNALAHLGITSPLLFASRTDKGVHASGAVASVECKEHFNDFLILKKQINKFAHPYIHIKNIERVSDNFEVRFCAKAREYRYIFCHQTFNPFLAPFVFFYPAFDTDKANKLLQYFVGEHDFKYFSKTKSNAKTSKRHIFFAQAYSKNGFSVFRLRANGFLRAQVRLTVSSILAVLESRLHQEQLLEQILAQKCYFRTLAPPNGLYLTRIIY
ncbi:tRNA pseudouridine(38-40) synthase TruA [Campylobacter sp. MIT 21-1685]|uniref:tRNA pseudouridine(38-40) synthase TruA n=1 Tax=unclassified Campylobacter TaxID=2593542 RepID=UPI00224A4DC8|nr:MULTISPECIES: tRNA pseudouridine(38-40) synthase TruA [unclassified Campylobacter]MCX2682772.1 tRNA pseudouridine(38-40) synthase TruA [Campylobacter sp. MIT 21-1684]MCX2751082.1 tRNA pseudouridine(38-40) synthase TruA [Campylobacter sp. MIT 21-1682]MCX2807253.1 tRNA pseudouridine(38-40) synthase TruA [Campylobacter sp. MIT 21-1685]